MTNEFTAAGSDNEESFDPFPGVQAELNQKLVQYEEDYKEFTQRVELEENPESSVAISKILINLQSDLDVMFETLNDLRDVVQVLLQGASQYNISAETLKEREKYVRNKETALKSLQQQLSFPLKKSATTSYNYQDEEANWTGIEEQSRYQQLLYEEQDSILDNVSHTIGNLRHQATEMGRELYDHSVILQQVDEHVENTADKLKKGMSRLNKFVRSNQESRNSCFICTLIFVLIILLLILIAI